MPSQSTVLRSRRLGSLSASAPAMSTTSAAKLTPTAALSGAVGGSRITKFASGLDMRTSRPLRGTWRRLEPHFRRLARPASTHGAGSSGARVRDHWRDAHSTDEGGRGGPHQRSSPNHGLPERFCAQVSRCGCAGDRSIFCAGDSGAGVDSIAARCETSRSKAAASCLLSLV